MTLWCRKAREVAHAAANKLNGALRPKGNMLLAEPITARLRSAHSMAQNLLGEADGFTERVTKGSKELYRVRFAGLDKDTAKAACHYFKRNEIECIALKH